MPTYVDSDIDRIKTLIKEKGIKQKHVCAQLGLSETYLSNIKNGKDRMTCERLKKIAEMLDTTTEYLTGHTDDPSPSEPKPPPQPPLPKPNMPKIRNRIIHAVQSPPQPKPSPFLPQLLLVTAAISAGVISLAEIDIVLFALSEK